MKSKGLTISVIFEAESANYGEGLGNVTTLKKVSRTNNGESYTYISRQALRYNIVNIMNDTFESLQLAPVKGGKGDVVQFSPDATIKDYFEIDLFGYMKTEKSKGSGIRSAIARLSHAISLEPFAGDTDFLTNKWMFDRDTKGSDKAEGGNIAQSETHKSFYAYTLTVDLDKVGIDGDESIENSEKKIRVKALLDAVKNLYRDIKGRRENLSPLFVIGGVYDNKNPYFMDRLKFGKDKGHKLNCELLSEVIENYDIRDNTVCGAYKGVFGNDNDIEKLNPVSIGEAFKTLDKKVEEYYG